MIKETVLTNFGLKSVLSLAGSTVVYLVGDQYLAFVALLILTFIDGCTGFYKAWYTGEVNSVRFRDKIKHYVAYCLVIMSMNQVLIIANYLQFLIDFVVLFFAAGEVISIMENLEEVGIPMPTYVKTKLMEVQKRKENRNAQIR